MSVYSTLYLFPLFSFVICIIGFGGSLTDAVVSLFLGLIVGGFEVWESKFPQFHHVKYFASAFLTVIFAQLALVELQKYGQTLNLQKAVLSAIVIHLPGLNLTLSILEISTRNIVCGIVRFFSSLFTALLLGFGYAMAKVVMTITEENITTIPLVPWQYSFLLLPFSSYMLCMMFEAATSQYPIMMLVSSVGFMTAVSLGSVAPFSNSTEGPIVAAAFVIGIISNIYARITNCVSLPPVLAGIIMLVPGSLGVKASLGFFDKQAEIGLLVAFQMLNIAMCITVGCFLGTERLISYAGCLAASEHQQEDI
jgi:uncharacterized membrane protein YjjB (DUF3815 family)